MNKLFQVVVLLFFVTSAAAQELYPIAEPASNVPKGALGVRAFAEGYKEVSIFRSVMGVRVLYGLTSKLSVYGTVTYSDYHEKNLPFDFISHDHSGGQLVSGTSTPAEGVKYPMIFNSIDFYAKYRFLTSDGANTHLRMAAYAEGAYVAVPSHEAEPELLIHTSGFGAGVITTYLHKHFAGSVTAGFIHPLQYSGNTYDIFGGIYPTTIKYGDAVNYSLSLGYLLFPRSYTGYHQTNWNIYCEFLGKAYTAAKVSEKDGPFPGALVYNVPNTTPILRAGNYIDAAPGIQCIIGSSTRIECSVQFPVVNLSYARLYPLYLVGVQRYFFFRKHTSGKSQ